RSAGAAMLGRSLLDATAPARRLARTVARAAENPRKYVRLPVDEIRVAVAASGDQPDIFGNGRVGRARPLAIDDLVEIVGVSDVRRIQSQSFCAGVGEDATPAPGARKAPPTQALEMRGKLQLLSNNRARGTVGVRARMTFCARGA